MAVTSANNAFIVEKLYWASDENLSYARTLQEVVCGLNPQRKLDYSVFMYPVINDEGGTSGPLPAFRVQNHFTDMEAYLADMKKESDCEKISSVSNATFKFCDNVTRVFYREVTPISITAESALDLITDEEKKMVGPCTADTIDPDVKAFYVLSNQNDSLRKPFEVQNTFWAKDGFEDIARKVAQFIAKRYPERALFFPFRVEGHGTLGIQPTYTFHRKFNNIADYTACVQRELSDPKFTEAMKILSICGDNFSRQFWYRKMN